MKKVKININLKDKIIHSTKISLVGKFANKVGVNNKFHRFCNDSWNKDGSIFVCPVDAKLVASGVIKNGSKIISKNNKEIPLSDILGNNADIFNNGFYLNFYLSPKDRHYWRIPCDCVLSSITLNKGKAVIPVFIGLEKIFKKRDFFKKAVKKNASIGMVFKTNKFIFGMIPVGSLNVNGIHVVDGENGFYNKGDIGGYFSIGSSMLLCFPKNNFEFIVKVGDRVKIGQDIIKLS